MGTKQIRIHLSIVYKAVFSFCPPANSPFFLFPSVSLFRHRLVEKVFCTRAVLETRLWRSDKNKFNSLSVVFNTGTGARIRAYVPSDLRGARIRDVQQPRKMLGRPIRSINTCALNVWELQSEPRWLQPMLLTRLDRFVELNENNFDALFCWCCQLRKSLLVPLTLRMKKTSNFAVTLIE